MRRLLLAAVLALIASGAQAATLNVVNGQLMGASDVLVDGSLYDVQFLAITSCIDQFDGCDEASDFTFHTLAAATLASQANLSKTPKAYKTNRKSTFSSPSGHKTDLSCAP